MERYTSLTKERLLNFKARVNESSIIKILTFRNADGTPRDISGKGWELPVKKSPYSRTDLFKLTEGNGLTVQGDDNNELAIEVSAERATVQPDVYFGRLYSSTEDKTWLDGDWEFHNGKYDGVTETDDITIYENGEEIIIEVSGSGGSVTLASIGETLETAALDIPVDADTFHFWDLVEGILKKISWANIKATLKTFFDTLYAPKGGNWNFAANGGNFPTAKKEGTIYRAEDDHGTFGDVDFVPAETWFMSKIDGANSFSQYSYKL